MHTADNGIHRDTEAVLTLLKSARAQEAALLLNTGLLPDGSSSAKDARTLQSAGKTISSPGRAAG